MPDKNGLNITTRDRVLRAWENSTELVRDFQNYANDTENSPKIAHMFNEYAKDEAMHAAELLQLLHEIEGKKVE